MDLNLEDRTAVVTGGSKGIGLAIADVLAREGAHVVVGARAVSNELERLVEDGRVTAVEVDLGRPDGPGHLVQAASRAHGGIDVLVNNVALSEPAPSTLDFDDEQWLRVFDLTLFTAVRMVREAVPHLRARPGSTIVNVGSLNARLPSGAIAPYSAAKAALANVGKALSEELVGDGIRVNTVSPGPVRTPLWTAPGGFAELMAGQLGVSTDEFMDRTLPELMSIGVGRVAEPAEIADLVAFLVSDRAAYITGSDVVIDGGMHKSVA